MATLRIKSQPGATKVFLTSLEGTGTPNPAGYNLTQTSGLIYEATITGLTGPFYAECKTPNGTVYSSVSNVAMVDDNSVIDTMEKATIRSAVSGRWTDEKGKTFDLTIEDTP
jgi:hypothetical protein